MKQTQNNPFGLLHRKIIPTYYLNATGRKKRRLFMYRKDQSGGHVIVEFIHAIAGLHLNRQQFTIVVQQTATML